ncbi:hypothetical protein FAVG1_11223 [Fusarium avenaceum]|nr:hypothetical protein FAVG1_11223 [Fusarium avenaceum]
MMSLFRAVQDMREQFWAEIFSLGSDEDYEDTHVDSVEDAKSVKKTPSPYVHKASQPDSSHPIANIDNRILRLPTELQLMILQHLTFGEVESLRRTCRPLRNRINKPFIREVFPCLKFQLLSTCFRCLRYDPVRDHLIHAGESDARYPLANECLDCVSSRGGFVVGRTYTLGTFATVCVCRYCGFPVTNDAAWKETYHWALLLELGILGLWIPTLLAILNIMEKRPEGPEKKDTATVFFIVCNISIFRFINILGNILLAAEYKLWRRFKPGQSILRRVLNKVAAFLIFWTYPPSIEQKFPGKWWLTKGSAKTAGV